MLLNTTNGKIYVGLTTRANVNIRIGQHRRSHRSNKGGNYKTAISRAIKKHGWDAFEIFVIEQCESKNELLEAEIKWIAHYNSLAPNGYNMTMGGEHYELSEMSRKKRSEMMMGHVVSEETRLRIGEANRGRKHSEEHKRKIANAGRGRKMPETTRTALQKANCGEGNGVSKLTWGKVREIRALFAEGTLTQYDLAPMYGVSVATISRIVKSKIWKEEGVEPIAVDHRFGL